MTMAKMITTIHCGNSPKMVFLEKFNRAYAEGNIPYLLECVTDDISWRMVGDQEVVGKLNFKKILLDLGQSNIQEMVIETIFTHGRLGAANGTLKMHNGSTYAFSDIYGFSSAKGNAIRSITSYVIEI